MFNSLYAVCLLVKDFEKSVVFYRDLLGLQINSQDKNYADFKLGDTLLAIFQKNQATDMFPTKFMNTGGGLVLAFKVEDVQKACDDLLAKNVEIFEGPKQTPWGQTVAYFKDVDDHIWEVTS